MPFMLAQLKASDSFAHLELFPLQMQPSLREGDRQPAPKLPGREHRASSLRTLLAPFSSSSPLACGSSIIALRSRHVNLSHG